MPRFNSGIFTNLDLGEPNKVVFTGETEEGNLILSFGSTDEDALQNIEKRVTLTAPDLRMLINILTCYAEKED